MMLPFFFVRVGVAPGHVGSLSDQPCNANEFVVTHAAADFGGGRVIDLVVEGRFRIAAEVAPLLSVDAEGNVASADPDLVVVAQGEAGSVWPNIAEAITTTTGQPLDRLAALYAAARGGSGIEARLARALAADAAAWMGLGAVLAGDEEMAGLVAAAEWHGHAPEQAEAARQAVLERRQAVDAARAARLDELADDPAVPPAVAEAAKQQAEKMRPAPHQPDSGGGGRA